MRTRRSDEEQAATAPLFANYGAARRVLRLKRRGAAGAGNVAERVRLWAGVFAVAKRFFAGKGFNIAIAFLDLISDIFFCILYLFDIQWALSHLDDPALLDLPGPAWLWISRLPVTFGACIWFSLFNLFSWILEVAFADNKFKSFFSLLTFINILTVLPFVFSIQFNQARFLYIPYFLRSIVAVDRLRKVLRLRGAMGFFNVSAVMEKCVILLGTLLAILYNGQCVFQITEFRFGGRTLNIFDCFYFVVVTLSTVGYGDISPSTKAGQFVVIVLIVTALTVLPSLISALISTYSEQKIGKGEVFTRGKASYFVVLGHFDTVSKVSDVLEGLLHEQTKKEKVVLLARAPASTDIQALITSYKYKDRVTYLVASGMDKSDLERAQVRHATAVYILADRGAADHRREDEKNTLRAWAIHTYAPDIPLYVNNLLPDTESYQEMNADGSLCTDDLKQLVLALTVMYDGASAFLINLLHISSPEPQYDTLWESQYGDGFGNELFVVQNNAHFVGLGFNVAAWIVFNELQINMIGVRVYDAMTGEKNLILNPGAAVCLGPQDDVVFIAQSVSDVDLFVNMTREEFQHILANNHAIFEAMPVARDSQQTLSGQHDKLQIQLSKGSLESTTDVPIVTYPRISDVFKRVSHRRASIPELNQLATLDFPETPYEDANIPQCRLLGIPSELKSLVVDKAVDWEGHLLVCTGDYDVFKFVCGLRASHLPYHHRILFLAERKPTHDEYAVLSVFPEINYMVGDPRQKKVLINAGIRGCSKVVIMKMGSYGSGEFAGSSSIMISHLIYNMYQRREIDHEKCVILETPRRTLINYLHPTPTTSSLSYRRYFRTAIKNVGKSVGLSKKKQIQQHEEQLKMGAKEKNIPGEVEYFNTPVFAAGRVVAASMLDSLLFQLHRNPCLLEITLVLCGVQNGCKREGALDGSSSGTTGTSSDVKKSWMGQIPVPSAFVNRTFGDLYQELALNHGIIPMGIHRGVNITLRNKLPFVFTNPLPSVLLLEGDLVFVLAP